MSEGAHSPGSIDLRPIAAATAVVIGMVATAALAYLLLDILLLLFIGIVVAAALQPWHVMLCRWGVPKGLAVLLIYLFLLIGLGLIALVVGPVLVDQISTFTAEVPGTYASVRSHLQASASAPVRLLGQRLPPFERLAQTLTEVAPQFYQGALGVTTSIVKLPAYFVTVLAIGFYWTMEVPRFERLLLSLLAVERRPARAQRLARDRVQARRLHARSRAGDVVHRGGVGARLRADRTAERPGTRCSRRAARSRAVDRTGPGRRSLRSSSPCRWACTRCSW